MASLGQNISTTRAADQTEAALFWAPNEQMWVCQFLRLLSQGNISRDAQRFARVTATMEDSAIDGFYWKYQDVFWRPYQALNQPGMPPWVPLRPTPNHPEYPSAHTFLMSPFVGLMEESTDDERPVTFNSSGGVASKTRSFEDLNDALQELKSSRVYIGFHYRNSTNVAEDLGRAWADTVIDNDYLGHAGDSERENGDSACEVGCNR